MAMALVLVGQAHAGLLSCGATKKPFVPWNDSTSYGLAPNGDLESGTTNVSLAGGAAVVGGNESFYVEGAGDNHSLRIPAGGSATIGQPCLSLLSLWSRFFVRNTGDPDAPLQIKLVYRGLLGNVVGILDLDGDVYADSSWDATPQLLMSGGVLAPVTATSMQIRLTVPAGSAGSFQVDDIEIDPWALR